MFGNINIAIKGAASAIGAAPCYIIYTSAK